MQRRFFVIAAFTSLALAIGAGACSNQGEGERCDKNDGNNGNDDCSSGLVCTSTTIYGGLTNGTGGGATAICCPTTGCQTGSSAGVGTSDLSDASTAVDSASDSSAGDSAATDGAVDGARDSAVDSATDAGTTVTDSASDAPLDSTAD